MNRTIVIASLLAGASVFAAPAMAQIGVIGGSIGTSTLEISGTDVDVDFLGVEGAVVIPAGGLFVQIDAGLNKLDDGSSDITSNYLSGHVGLRNAQWAAGGYLAVTHNDNTDTDGLLYGVDGAYFLPQLTFAGGIGAGSIDDADVDFFGFGAEVRYFLSDNLRIDGGVVSTNVEGPGGDIDVLGLGAEVEFKPDNFPISVFGAFDNTDFGDADVTVSTFSVGVRFDFGSGTLKLRDRTGPTFNAIGGFVEGTSVIF